MLEGVATFISPCLLPMLPIYIAYFAGESGNGRRTALLNSICFVLGFTIPFIAMGAFAATLGAALVRHQTAVNIVTGVIVAALGLGILTGRGLSLGRMGSRFSKGSGPVSTMLFGAAFAVAWTPCVGAYLGSALMLASQRGSMAEGVVMLLCYSLGLGIPFVLSAVLIDRLKSAFDFIKRHYRVINTVSGVLLIAMGVMMATGLMGRFLSLLS